MGIKKTGNFPEPKYTKEMRINHEPCPYCGEWHTTVSCPPIHWFSIGKIKELEEDIENYRGYLTTIMISVEDKYDAFYLRQIAREGLEALKDGSFPK